MTAQRDATISEPLLPDDAVVATESVTAINARPLPGGAQRQTQAPSNQENGLLTGYARLLRDYPIRTNLASSAIALPLGDLLAQTIETYRGNREHLDGVRSAVMLTWAVFGDMPLNLGLFFLIDRAFTRCGVPKTKRSLPLSMLRACCFTIPGSLLRNPLYIVFTAIGEHTLGNALSGQPPSTGWTACTATVRERLLGRDLFEIVRTSLLVWLPVNTIGFQCIPAHFRPLFVSGAQVCWNTYLSFTSHRPLDRGAAVAPVLPPVPALPARPEIPGSISLS